MKIVNYIIGIVGVLLLSHAMAGNQIKPVQSIDQTSYITESSV